MMPKHHGRRGCVCPGATKNQTGRDQFACQCGKEGVHTKPRQRRETSVQPSRNHHATITQLLCILAGHAVAQDSRETC